MNVGMVKSRLEIASNRDRGSSKVEQKVGRGDEGKETREKGWRRASFGT